MTALFLSDLHLPDEPSPLREGFLRFLAGPARSATQVYLLGDIFEYWIGDRSGLRAYATEVAALRALSDSGVQLFFMHGNRDFLVGKQFAKACGIKLLRDPSIVEAGGRRMLLSHGDVWCTDDLAYQRWRLFSRNRLAQRIFLWLPERQRLKIAGGLRGHSGQTKRYKPEAIMDVNADAIASAFERSQVEWIVHGHTHRPADHTLQIDGRTSTRIVLADWHPDYMEYLRVDASTIERCQV